MTGSFSAGLSIGFGVFLTWALAREIDPKHNQSAFLAAALSLITLFFYDTIQLLVMGWLLLLLRLVNGISGKELTVFDLFSMLAFTVYLSFSNENSIFLMIFLLAILLISRGRKLTGTLVIVVGISSVIFVVESFFLDYLSFNSFDVLDPLTLSFLVASGLSFIVFRFLSKEKAKDDKGNRLHTSRLLAGQVLYSASVLLLYFFGDMSLNSVIIYTSVLIGVILYYSGSKLLQAFQ